MPEPTNRQHGEPRLCTSPASGHGQAGCIGQLGEHHSDCTAGTKPSQPHGWFDCGTSGGKPRSIAQHCWHELGLIGSDWCQHELGLHQRTVHSWWPTADHCSERAKLSTHQVADSQQSVAGLPNSYRLEDNFVHVSFLCRRRNWYWWHAVAQRLPRPYRQTQNRIRSAKETASRRSKNPCKRRQHQWNVRLHQRLL